MVCSVWGVCQLTLMTALLVSGSSGVAGPGLSVPNASQPGQSETTNTSQPGQSETTNTSQPGQSETTNTSQPGQSETTNTSQPGQSETTNTSQPGQSETNNTSQPGQSETANTSQPGQSETPCGDGMCLCTGVSAQCSDLLGEVITYIPNLPTHIATVVIMWCRFSSDVLTDNFFANLTNMTNITTLLLLYDSISWLPPNAFAGTNISTLHLSYNNISWLPRNVWAGMDELRVLALDGNTDLKLETLREMFSIPTLTSVSLKRCNLSPPPADFFQNITSNVKDITLDDNLHFGVYNMEGFCALQFLNRLSFRHCRFSGLSSPCPLQQLSILDLTDNSLRKFPRTCGPNNMSIFPDLTVLILTRNRMSFLSRSDICLPSLMHLDISYNHITDYPSFIFGSLYFPVLKRLFLHHQLRLGYLDNYQITQSVKDYAFNNDNLEEIDLSNNRLDFADPYLIGKHAFSNRSRMKYLHLNANNFTFVDDQRFLELFGHLHSLVNLSMSNSKVESVTIKTFANFRNLTKLSLDSNMIADIPDGAFDSLHKLQLLFLRNNKIKTINEHTFSKRLRKSLSSLTLGFNPFLCSCDLMWFTQWYLAEQNQLFKDHTAEYKCQNIPGMALANFSVTEQACLLSHETSVVLIQFCSIIILTLALVSMVFRYRWHLRLLMYEVFRGRDVLRRQRLLANNFDYDVFVSYASEELPWVRQQLMTKLEDDLGLKLCLHDRDFLPGAQIVDNIVQSVESSKKIIMVFSTHFVRSQWCQFELAWCLTHVLDYDDALIVVCVDDVTSCRITPAMRAVVKTTTYIQWREEEEDAIASFWGRLRLALHEILPREEHYV